MALAFKNGRTKNDARLRLRAFLPVWVNYARAFWSPRDWVFASVQEKGRQPYWPENRRKAIKKADGEAGISKRVGFHRFRHTLLAC